MFQTVTPGILTSQNYQDIVIGVYQTLINKNGKIYGFVLPLNSKPGQFDFSDIIGVKPLVKFFASINYAFPDYEMRIETLVIKGEKVMSKYSIWGIQRGKILGRAPTNRRIKITGLDIFRLDHGKVVEYWNANHYIEPGL